MKMLGKDQIEIGIKTREEWVHWATIRMYTLSSLFHSCTLPWLCSLVSQARAIIVRHLCPIPAMRCWATFTKFSRNVDPHLTSWTVYTGSEQTRAPRDAGPIPSRPVPSRRGTGRDSKNENSAGRDRRSAGCGTGRDYAPKCFCPANIFSSFRWEKNSFSHDFSWNCIAFGKDYWIHRLRTHEGRGGNRIFRGFGLSPTEFLMMKARLRINWLLFGHPQMQIFDM